MAYNLPPSWDPGFAMPDNALDEGLERRAFVTKQMPRGTYDQPKVGTGGYAVPRYVLDEGYGQGTFTTKWQPSGTYNGPRVPPWLNRRPELVRSRALPGGGREVTVQPLGDAPLPEPFEAYGARAAQILLSKAASVPPGARNAALRKIMDAVDKSLWSRTQDIWHRYLREGMPPAQALPLAIARAMSSGIAAEIINAGLRRSAPQARSLLGLGCYGRSAVMGAMGDDAATCAAPAGFTWVPASGTVGGHWARLRAGATANPGPCGADGATVTPVIRDRRDATAPIDRKGAQYVQLSPTPDFAEPIPVHKDTPYNKIRDFTGMPDVVVFPSRVPPGMTNLPQTLAMTVAELPESWRKWIREDVTTPGDWKNHQVKPNQWPADKVPADFWYKDVIGIPDPRSVTLYSNRNSLPQAVVKWPGNGDTGIFYLFEKLNRRSDGKYGEFWPEDSGNPVVLKIWIGQWPDQSLEWDIKQLFNKIKRFFAKVIDVVVDALEELGDAACGLLGTPGIAEAAGAAGGAAAGIPPQAGAAAGHAGAQIAKGVCGGPPPPPPPPPPPVSSISPTTLAILGGVGAVALVLLSGGKKKP